MKIVIRQLKLLSLIGLSILTFIFILSINATPSSPFPYQFKRLQEKTKLKIVFNKSNNLKYQLQLLEKRLIEIESLVSHNEHSYILKSSLRYSATAGQLTNYLIANNLKGEIPNVLDVFSRHQQILTSLVESYPKEIDNEWKFIQDDFNYLTIYSEQLKQIK